MLLLDEPFGMLDSLTRFELQQVLIDLWARTSKTALMVTHDVDRSAVPLRPHRHDDQRPGGQSRRDPRRALPAPARRESATGWYSSDDDARDWLIGFLEAQSTHPVKEPESEEGDDAEAAALERPLCALDATMMEE